MLGSARGLLSQRVQLVRQRRQPRVRLLEHDGAAAFAHILHAAPDQSVVVQVQSGMADVARAIRQFPALFKRKVCLCSIMGGLRNIGSQEAGDGSEE